MSEAFKANIVSIANKLRSGDRVTIWANKYQVHMKTMGTSNFDITDEDILNVDKTKKNRHNEKKS